jgi:hypothetical protein
MGVKNGEPVKIISLLRFNTCFQEREFKYIVNSYFKYLLQSLKLA